MHGLEILVRINSGVPQPELPGLRLRYHPRILELRQQVARLPVEEFYRRLLFRSINVYADQIVARPQYAPEEGWDDLEALQQVALGDWMESAMRAKFGTGTQ
jgi:hypothetical protein